jgi:hypothetical protein
MTYYTDFTWALIRRLEGSVVDGELTVFILRGWKTFPMGNWCVVRGITCENVFGMVMKVRLGNTSATRRNGKSCIPQIIVKNDIS